jgi:CheY-like chemotaxis protein
MAKRTKSDSQPESLTHAHRLLIVGDGFLANAIRELALEGAGHFVITATGLSSAKEAVQNSSIDLAVVDSSFPSSDTRHLLNALRLLGIPNLLVGEAEISVEIKALADAHLPSQDGVLLVAVVNSMVRNLPNRKRSGGVPLGFNDEIVMPGEHLAWFCANDGEFELAVRFLELGFKLGDTAIIFGDDRDNEQVRQVLTGHGFQVDELIEAGRLLLIDVKSTVELGNAWVQKARELIDSLCSASMVRVLGSGSLRLPWTSHSDFLAYEAQVDEAIRGTQCIVLCIYDLREVSAQLLFEGGLGRHRTVVTSKGVVREHAFVSSRTELQES